MTCSRRTRPVFCSSSDLPSRSPDRAPQRHRPATAVSCSMGMTSSSFLADVFGRSPAFLLVEPELSAEVIQADAAFLPIGAARFFDDRPKPRIGGQGHRLPIGA